MLDQFWALGVFVLLNFLVMALWRLAGRPIVVTLLSILLWIAIPMGLTAWVVPNADPSCMLLLSLLSSTSFVGSRALFFSSSGQCYSQMWNGRRCLLRALQRWPPRFRQRAACSSMTRSWNTYS